MTTSAKAKASALLEAVNGLNAGRIEELVHPDYIQHNPHIPTGRAAFLGLLPVLEQYGTKVETVRMIEDGDYAVAHNVWRNSDPFGAPEMVSFDVLRIGSDGLIAEHWDGMMPNTAPNASGRTLVDGQATVEHLEHTEENRARVVRLFELLITGTPGDMAAALPDFFHPDYRQHNPDAADGIEGFADAIQSGRLAVTFTRQHKVLAQGNFVLSISEGTRGGNPAVLYDLMRFVDGKVAEHWDVVQDIPPASVNDNTMFGFPASSP